MGSFAADNPKPREPSMTLEDQQLRAINLVSAQVAAEIAATAGKRDGEVEN